MRVLFRADASIEIGTGHVMRCIALATEWRAQSNIEIVFVCRALEGNLCELVEANGFRVIRLPTKNELNQPQANEVGGEYANWLGVTEEQDAQDMVGCLSVLSADFVVVDHYGLGEIWGRAISRFTKCLIVLDDLANRKHYCDVLIDSSPGRSVSAYEHLVPNQSNCLTGPKFAILRKEFLLMRPTSLNRQSLSACRHILVTMGGVDKGNATNAVLEAIRCSSVPRDTRITVVLGQNAPWKQNVIEKIRTMQQRTNLMIDVSNMSELMCQADLAIGAAGSTALERCCMGLPSIQVVLAENQMQSAVALQSLGAALTAEGAELIEAIRLRLNELIGNPERISLMSRRSAEVVDGLGVTRILDEINARATEKKLWTK